MENAKVKLKRILVDRLEQLVMKTQELEYTLTKANEERDKYSRWYHEETEVTTRLRKQVKLLTEQLDEAGIVVEATGYEEANA